MASYIKRHKNFILAIIFGGICYGILFYLFKHFGIDQESIHSWIVQFGAYSIFALFALQLIGSLTPIPDVLLTAIGMILYGPFWGAIIVFLGMYTAGTIHFFIARKLGKDFIIKKFPEVGHLANKFSSKNPITRLTYLRMFQVITFDVTSYIAGFSGATFWQFSISFLLGMLPHLISYAFITQGLFADGSPWNILPGVTIFVVMFIISMLPKKSDNSK